MYTNLLYNNTTQHYRKAIPHTHNDINKGAKDIVTKFTLDQRIDCLAKRETYFRIKRSQRVLQFQSKM